MIECPVCNAALPDEADTCPVCGYHFKEATLQFKPVQVDSTGTMNAVGKTTTATLTVKYGKQEGIVYQLDTNEATIGRSPQCDVFLNDMTVSRTHALLEKINGAWTIKDKDSFNGVWINNKNIDFATLRNGDIIQIGCFVLKYSE